MMIHLLGYVAETIRPEDFLAPPAMAARPSVGFAVYMERDWDSGLGFHPHSGRWAYVVSEQTAFLILLLEALGDVGDFFSWPHMGASWRI